MKLQPYEILSHVLPGFIVYAVLIYSFPETIPQFEALPSIAIAFFIGYYINMLSSLLESFYFSIWGGKPSNQILEKDLGKIKLYQRQQIIDYLKKDIDKNEASYNELFSVATRVANNSSNERIKDFNSNYALARGMLTCVLTLGIISIFKYYENPRIWIFFIILLFASSYRAKQRGYYFAREVLNTYLAEKKK